MQVDGQVYIVPVDAGTAGIMYNADVITTPPDVVDGPVRPAVRRAAPRSRTSPITALDVGALANGIDEPAGDDRRASSRW